MNLLKGMIVMLLAALPLSAGAETVVGGKVNCRAAARTNASVLGTLRRGQGVPVLSTSGAWSYVDPANLPACYVKSDLLASSSDAITETAYRSSARSRTGRASYRKSRGLYSTPRYASSTRRRLSPGRSRARGAYYGGGSCPCSGSNICVGPRGGRYCITNGGSKRYGV